MHFPTWKGSSPFTKHFSPLKPIVVKMEANPGRFHQQSTVKDTHNRTDRGHPHNRSSTHPLTCPTLDFLSQLQCAGNHHSHHTCVTLALSLPPVFTLESTSHHHHHQPVSCRTLVSTKEFECPVASLHFRPLLLPSFRSFERKNRCTNHHPRCTYWNTHTLCLLLA